MNTPRCPGPGEPGHPGDAWSSQAPVNVLAVESAMHAYLPALRPFDEFGTGSALTAAAQEFTDVVVYDLPQGWVGMLHWWGADADVAAAHQNVQWRVTINEAAYVTYDQDMGQVAGMTADLLRPLAIPLPSGSKLKLQARNAHATTAYTVRGCLKGYRHPDVYREQ